MKLKSMFVLCLIGTFSMTTFVKAADLSKTKLRRIPIEKRWDCPVPTAVPEVDGVLFDGVFYSGCANHPLLEDKSEGYTPIREGGFSKSDGKRYFNRPIFYKGCMISTGDRPMFLIHRGFSMGWCSKLRFSYKVGDKAKWLDEFESIYTEFWPGATYYTCRDSELGVELKLTARTGMVGWSSLFEIEITEGKEGTLSWIFGDIENYAGHKDWMFWLPPLELEAEANNTASKAGDNIYKVTIDDSQDDVKWKKLHYVCLKTLEYYAGSNWPGQRMMQVEGKFTEAPVELIPSSDGKLVACQAPVEKGWKGIMAVVWGGEPLDIRGYEQAMRDLNIEWGMDIYRRWYENLVGRGTGPDEKMRQIMESPDDAFKQAEDFWEKIRNRIVINLPDDELNAWANWLAATQEYLHFPVGQMAGLDSWGQGYSHISNAYDGWDYLGMHDQQQDWLRTFAASVRKGWIGIYHGIAPWFTPLDRPNGGEENEMTHFVNVVYTNWLWTADDQFVKDVWPFAKQLMERELMQNDPDGDGLFAARMPDWAPENDSFGPKSQVESVQALRALEGCVRMAKVAGDKEAAKRYGDYAKKIKLALPSLWNNKAGILGYRGPDDVLKINPDSTEIFYPILRNAVTPQQGYQMLRYSREVLMATDACYPGVARVMLSAHHVGKTGLGALTDMSWRTVTAAGIVGDMDQFYPVLKTFAHAYFFSSWPGGEAAAVARNGSGAAGMNDHNDGRMPALYALGRGLFGFEPDVPNGRITIEPRFPKDWKKASIKQPTIGYSFEKTDEQIIMKVTTAKPLEKILRIPVLRQVKRVTLDGKKVNFEIDAGINRCFVVVRTPESTENEVVVDLTGPELEVCYESKPVVGVAFKVKVEGAEKLELDDPQEALKVVKSGKDELELIPVRQGSRTAFVKAKRGNIAVYLPLDLRVVEAFEISNPTICKDESRLKFDLVNRSGKSKVFKADVEIAGSRTEIRIDLSKGERIAMEVNLGQRTMSSILPGSNPIKLTIDGKTYVNKFVDWDAWGASQDKMYDRAILLDMAWDYHEEASDIFNTKFYYDIWQMGINYPTKPSATYEYAGCQLQNPKLDSPYFLGAEKIPFYVTDEKSLGGLYQPQTGGGPRNVLPVANWRPGLYPSNIVIPAEGMRLCKAYFLAYSWYRAHQAHHPNVELKANYVDGTSSQRQLIPPFSFKPIYGKESVNRTPYRIEVLKTALPLGTSYYAEIYDLPINPTKPLESIEVRSVTSESIFAIFGITFVEAE